jgi:hypothetical protein
MLTTWDEVVAEVDQELEAALRFGDSLGLGLLEQWVAARRQLIDRASQRMYRALFQGDGTGKPAGVVG